MISFRSLVAAAGLVLGLASAAPAATVAAFQGSALASLTLVSATFSDTGQAADAYIDWLYADDEDGAGSSGSATAIFDYCADLSSCLENSGEIGGSATLGTPASAFSYGYLDFALFYGGCATCTGSVTLDFAYDVEVAGGTSVTGPGAGTATVGGFADVYAGGFGRVSASFAGTRSLSGSFQLALAEGQSIFLGTEFGLTGAAAVSQAGSPAPVPLPATLPLLFAGAAGLGLWSRRRT